MSIIDAVMPNTAALHRHVAHAASVKSVSSVAKKRDPQHAKYIVVKTPTGPPLPILFSKGLQHKDMVPPGHTAISAGYVLILAGEICIPPIDSFSLCIGPKPEDKRLLSQLLNQ